MGDCRNGCEQGGDHLEFVHVARNTLEHYPHAGSKGPMVYLHVYHLSQNWRRPNSVSNLLKLGGAFHVGVEVYDVEWSYGESGITWDTPNAQAQEPHAYYASICMGETPLSVVEVNYLIATLEREWLGEEYHMLEHNCCNFADALCQDLAGEALPAWVSRFPQLASSAAIHLDGVVDVKSLAKQFVVAEENPTSESPPPLQD
jgi:hypothetical protein